MAQVVRIDFDQGALHALLEKEDGETARDLKRRAQNVERRAKDLCPKRSGALAASIRTEPYELDGGTPTLRIGTDEPYAIYVEKGTSRMEAEPFLEPALDAARD